MQAPRTYRPARSGSLIGLVTLGLMAAAPAHADRTLEATIDAEDLAEVSVEARVGELRVMRSDDERIHVSVTLEPDDDWFSHREDVEAAIDAAELDQDIRGDRIGLSLDMPRRGYDDGDVEEHWEVRVPARFRADLSLNVGSLTVFDLAGGIEATNNVGEMEIDVPEGSVDAHINVGDMRVTNATPSHGRIDLRANVGGVSLRLHGDRRSGEGGFGPGESLRVHGDGVDDIALSVNVGDVRLEIRD